MTQLRNIGWVCPVCHAVYGPSVEMCPNCTGSDVPCLPVEGCTCQNTINSNKPCPLHWWRLTVAKVANEW